MLEDFPDKDDEEACNGDKEQTHKTDPKELNNDLI